MSVVIDEVQTTVEQHPPVSEAAPDQSKPRPALDPRQAIRTYALIKERELRLQAD